MADIETAVKTEEAAICDAYKAYMACMDAAMISPFMNKLGGEWYSTFTAVIENYCDQGIYHMAVLNGIL